jgi:hypothetical protein
MMIRKGLGKISVVIILSAILFFGCAEYEKRQRIKEEMGVLSQRIATWESNIRQIEHAIDEENIYISRLGSEARAIESNKSELQIELGSYIWDHKLASAGAIAIVGGVASFLDDTMDKDAQAALEAAGLAAIAYCAFNHEECLDAGAEILAFAAKFDALDEKVSAINDQANSRRRLVQAKLDEKNRLYSEVENFEQQYSQLERQL